MGLHLTPVTLHGQVFWLTCAHRSCHAAGPLTPSKRPREAKGTAEERQQRRQQLPVRKLTYQYDDDPDGLSILQLHAEERESSRFVLQGDSLQEGGCQQLFRVPLDCSIISAAQLSSRVRPRVMVVLLMSWHQADTSASLDFHLWQLFTCLEDAVQGKYGGPKLVELLCMYAALHRVLFTGSSRGWKLFQTLAGKLHGESTAAAAAELDLHRLADTKGLEFEQLAVKRVSRIC